jgi:hypothetical protein
VLYVATVAPGPLWQDNGLAQVRALRHDLYGGLGLALSHPLYYLIAIAFQKLPFAESAYKTNLVASVFGALTVGNVYLLLRLLTTRRAAAVVGTISLAVAHTFWQHCALAEVYTVSTALLTAELLCLVQYACSGKSAWLLTLFVLNGLGVSNHMLAALNLPVWIVLLVWLAWRRRRNAVLLPAAAVLWVIGAGIYLSMIAHEVAAGQSLGAVLRSALFGDQYAGNVLNIHIGAGLIGRALLYLGLNFPTPVALLALLGLGALWRPAAAGWPIATRPIGALLVIHLLWGLHYNVPDQYTFFIPAIVLIAIALGLGADRFLAGRGRAWVVAAVALAALPPLVYLPLPRIVRAAGLSLGVRREIPYRDTYSYFLWPWKAGDQGPLRFATEVRRTLPDGALLLADDTAVRPIHYLMETDRWRRDVAVWPALGGPENTPWPTATDLARPLQTGRLYVVSPVPGYCPGWLLEHYTFEPAGVLYRVAGLRQPGEPGTRP